jgi:hypothetical protein
MTTPLEPSAHEALRGLLGAWALDACPAGEAARLEAHLAGCPSCAEEARRLRDAAGWLAMDEPLDPEPSLRRQVLTGCLERRDAAFGVPAYADPFVAETARLDALLRDLGELDWLESAQLSWHGGTEQRRPAEVLCHLAAVDGVLARALGLPDPADGDDLVERTARVRSAQARNSPETVRAFWREQTRAIVERVALADAESEAASVPVDYGVFRIPVADVFLDRAFECWIHADDIAEAVGYPYYPPRGAHLRQLIGLASRLLPVALAGLREAGLAESRAKSAEPRVLKLIIEGRGESEWLVPLDGPPCAEVPADARATSSLAIDGVEFCFLTAARRDPRRVPVGVTGDAASARDVLSAAPLLSRP